MRILILGGAGMLGHRLWLALSQKHDVWATLRGSAADLPAHFAFPRHRACERVDVLATDDLLRVLGQVRPETVINCVGLIKQSPLAQDPLLAIALNASLPHRLARLCQASGARLIHISTDCVFSGRRGRYTEADISDAEDLYGRTKFLGEVAEAHTLTVRTSIVGRELRTRFGLIEWFLHQTGIVSGYRRALYSGLTTHELARVIAQYILPQPDLHGLYHVAGPAISKYDLLRQVHRLFNTAVTLTPDDRVVCDRSLDAARFQAAAGYVSPSWETMLSELAADSQ